MSAQDRSRRRHAREGGHPVFAGANDRIESARRTGSSAFADDDRSRAESAGRSAAGTTPLTVIARSISDEAIHSFRAALDCFAEPVIGPAFARPAGSQ